MWHACPGHISKQGMKVDLELVEHFIQAFGSYENAIVRSCSERCVEQRKASKDSWSSLKHTGTSISHASQSLQLEAKDLRRSVNGFHHVVSNGPESSKAIVDKINLGEEEWKERYYDEKFHVKIKDDYKILRRHADHWTSCFYWEAPLDFLRCIFSCIQSRRLC